MKLKNVEIALKTWGENEGKYICKIAYEGQCGSTEMILDPAVSEALLGFIGPVLTEFAHKASLKLEQDIQQSIEEAQKGKALPA